MKYVIAIEPGDETHAYGVVIPDLPGCFSAGDTLEEAFSNAKEAAELWLETTLDDGLSLPQPSKAEDLMKANPEFAGWIWSVVDIDVAALSDKAERINITLPARVLRRLDAIVSKTGETRSGFIARQILSKSL